MQIFRQVWERRLTKSQKISQSEKIRISADKTKSEKLFFNCKNGENAFADVELYAPENTELTVFMTMQSAWNANGIVP